MHLRPRTRVRECGAMSGVFTRRFGLARTALSPTSRMHFSTDFKCIWARALGLGAWGHVALFHGDLSTHTHKPLRHQPHECISASTLNAFAPCTRVWECGARFGHSQTASSPTSRMHFSTGSKCICARALGFGSVGPCWTFTRRFGHAKNRFVTTRTNAIRHGF